MEGRARGRLGYLEASWQSGKGVLVLLLISGHLKLATCSFIFGMGYKSLLRVEGCIPSQRMAEPTPEGAHVALLSAVILASRCILWLAVLGNALDGTAGHCLPSPGNRLPV